MVLRINVNPDARPSLGGPDSAFVESPQPEAVDLDAFMDWSDRHPNSNMTRFLRDQARARLRIDTRPETIGRFANRWTVDSPSTGAPWGFK